MSRKRRYSVPSWQCDPASKVKHFNQVYDSLLDSKAFCDLPLRARGLYLYCLRQTFSDAMRDNAPEGGQGDGRLFYLNAELVRRFGLYTNARTFAQDMSLLVDHGFIDQLASGYRSGGRAKNVYRMSSRWLRWGTPEFEMPDSCKTALLRRAESS